MTDPVLRWPGVTKDPDDTMPMTLSVWALCATFWTANEEHELGDYVWPNITVVNGQIVKGANGFVNECTAAGRSGSREPRWVLVPDVQIPTLDGSVGWTPRVGSQQGIAAATGAVVSNIVCSDGVSTDFDTSTVIVDEGTKLLVDYSGGTLGLEYEIEFRFAIGGRQRVGRQLVTIAKT